jgi:hypothetical protein
MFWSRRRGIPWWLAFLALIGLKTVWRSTRDGSNTGYEAKRARFWAKIGEAFQVWREPDEDEPAPADE